MLSIIQTVLIIFIAWFLVSQKSERLAGPFAKRRRIVLDSCALIDGRIVEIVSGGFISDELVIPQFILNELQLLADGNDSHKRERARFGLDIAHQLQDTNTVRVLVDRSVFPEAKAIDDKLVLLARKLKAQLYTTDYNLSKVAAVEGVRVLNVNELAQNLRPITLPGETLNIKILQRGSNRDQGVGYLEDGTMIVVDGAARLVNKLVPVTVTRMHQTVAGKMVFGQVARDKHTKTNEPEVAARPNEARAKDALPVNGTAPTPAASAKHHIKRTVGQHAQSAGSKLHGRLTKTLRRRASIQ